MSGLWRFLFIGILIAPGLVHVAVWVLVPEPAPGKEAPFDASHSWLLGNHRALAATVAAAMAAVLVVAGSDSGRTPIGGALRRSSAWQLRSC